MINCFPNITINQHDSVSTDEIEIGDNDTLGAIVAESVSADIVAILTDTNGLYTADPRKDKTAKLLSIIEEITDDIFNLGAGSGTKLGTGGMKTKIGAAEIAVNAGIDVYIINGERPFVLYDIIEGKKFIGTKFCAKK